MTVKPYVRNYDADSAEIVFSDGDTTLRHRVGEFVRLGGSYYRIDSLRPDGRELRLTPTPDALDRPSAQVGFRPIPFEATTTDGRRVRFPEDFAGPLRPARLLVAELPALPHGYPRPLSAGLRGIP